MAFQSPFYTLRALLVIFAVLAKKPIYAIGTADQFADAALQKTWGAFQHTLKDLIRQPSAPVQGIPNLDYLSLSETLAGGTALRALAASVRVCDDIDRHMDPIYSEAYALHRAHKFANATKVTTGA